MLKTNPSANKRAQKASGEKPRHYWSGEVTRNSNALDLEPNIFASSNPRKIAASVRHSAEVSKRRKGTVFQSAMSMLNFYMNRAGANLSVARKNTLGKAKRELRAAFGRGPTGENKRQTK